MVLKTKGSASFFTRNYRLSFPRPGEGGMTDEGAASAEIPLIRGFLLKKADAADGTGSEGQIQLFRRCPQHCSGLRCTRWRQSP